MNLEAIAAALDVDPEELEVLPSADEKATLIATRAPGKLGPDDTVYRIAEEGGVSAVSVDSLDTAASQRD